MGEVRIRAQFGGNGPGHVPPLPVFSRESQEQKMGPLERVRPEMAVGLQELSSGLGQGWRMEGGSQGLASPI